MVNPYEFVGARPAISVAYFVLKRDGICGPPGGIAEPGGGLCPVTGLCPDPGDVTVAVVGVVAETLFEFFLAQLVISKPTNKKAQTRLARQRRREALITGIPPTGHHRHQKPPNSGHPDCRPNRRNRVRYCPAHKHSASSTYLPATGYF